MASGFPPLSFRALVAESSHCEVKPLCCHFLDAATARSMTGGCSMFRRARTALKNQQLVVENRDTFLEAWNGYFGG